MAVITYPQRFKQYIYQQQNGIDCDPESTEKDIWSTAEHHLDILRELVDTWKGNDVESG